MYEKLLTPPAVEPVTVEEQCLFSRIPVPGANPDPDRVFIESCITAAREYIEQITKSAIIKQQWLMTLDVFPGQEDRYQIGLWQGYLLPGIFFPYSSLRQPTEQSIELLRRPGTNEEGGEISVTYLDLNGDEQTVDSSTYIFFADKITLLPQNVWPVAALMADAVRVTYWAGYGEDATSCPQRLKQAIKYLAGHFYETRNMATNELTREVTMTLSNLLGAFRNFRVPR
jgi:hypothetical protein